MNSDIFSYIVLISVSGVLTSVLGMYAFAKRKTFSAGNIFVWIAVTSAIYIFGHAFELTADSLAEIKFWIAFQYAGLPFISPITLVMVMRFTGLDRYLTSLNLIIFYTIPFISMVMVLTNDWHGLFYTQYHLHQEGSYLLVDMDVGFWYVIHGSFTFGSLFAGACMVVWYWKRAGFAYRRQLITMFAGLTIPMTASFLYLMGYSPYGMDPVPMVMCLTSFLYLRSFFMDRLTAAPIAKERVFESMRDGVLVFAQDDVLVDYNPAAKEMLPGLDSKLIGENMKVVLQSAAGYSGAWAAGGSYSGIHKFEGEIEVYLQIHSFPIKRSSGELAGTTVILSNITKEVQLRQELEELAFKDGLTGIYNRTYFIEQSGRLLQEADAAGGTLSVILFDIDFFKHINDKYGHLQGDEALRHIARVSGSRLGGDSIFARYGGEEFVICLPGANLEAAAEKAEKIRAGIEEELLFSEKGMIPLTASFGAAETAPGMTLERLLHNADTALYQSKYGGRNRVTCCDSPVSVS
ncbi:histidine kinase N-terminal 7TM domain-containing diguanylate cyclase [Bacillus infantis]|uniref:histidine kinase N-terminal 7TM domain-containing diguanylate cyclase n=1 Tax=Bacillus infantis TaxID=324767 RepID=UPI002155B299|nr:histidine kinase N-terminal 7TM domain-containing protein [Bacillus infantis]MCR6612661.1 diguanylate cyclase [Bacillus infantis]